MPRRLFPFLAALFVASVLVACWPTTPGGEVVMSPRPATLDAGPPPADASHDTTAPDASHEAAPAASAPAAPPPPEYHAGDYRRALPTGAVTIATPDGGLVRVKDGLDCPCIWGCAAWYQSIENQETRALGHAVDGAELHGDELQCVANCKADRACKHGWPGVSEQ